MLIVLNCLSYIQLFISFLRFLQFFANKYFIKALINYFKFFEIDFILVSYFFILNCTVLKLVMYRTHYPGLDPPGYCQLSDIRFRPDLDFKKRLGSN